jgi:hypothetical protein
MMFALEALFLAAFIASPILLVHGWRRWARREQPRTLPARLSLAGFSLATASALLAVGSFAYSTAIGGFPFYDPRLLSIFFAGGVLSLLAILFAVGGLFRPGPLRWHALLCALGTLGFWFFQANGE